MNCEDNDTVLFDRLFANIIKYTLPGQIKLPLNWVRDDDEHEKSLEDDASNNLLNILNSNKKIITNVIGKSGVAESEDGELPEGSYEKYKNRKKENIPVSTTSGNTSFNSSNESNNALYNDFYSNDGYIWGSKFAKEKETIRPKFSHSICKFFREGNCRESDSCCYSHNAADSNRKPKLCKGYLHGKCRKNLSCPFLHGEYPCKDFVYGRCSAVRCRFSHQPPDDYTRSIVEKTMKSKEEGNAGATYARPNSPPFSSSYKNSLNYPSKFSHQSRPFSSSSNNPIIRTNSHSLSYNKKSFRDSVAHPYQKSSSSKSIPFRNVSTNFVNKNHLSGVAVNLPHLRQYC